MGHKKSSSRGPEAILLSGHGINCERETAHALKLAGAEPKVVHINDVIADKRLLGNCKIIVFPGGFSRGDDTGSGLAYASDTKDNLRDELLEFIERDTLSLGICNGFQIMNHLGYFPVNHDGHHAKYLTDHAIKTDLTFNTNARYRDLWVHLKQDMRSKCVWTRGTDVIRARLPIRHGEGRFYATPDIIKSLGWSGQIVFRYCAEDGTFPEDGSANPNGSVDDIAGICDPTGRHFGLMPHPEVAIHRTQDAIYHRKREIAKRKEIELPEYTSCLALFRNAVQYFE